MKKSKKGMTIIELLISIVIISLVITFILQLYIRIRGAYLTNSVEVKYELSKSIIIDAVMSDFVDNRINSIETDENKITFNFNYLTKILKVTDTDDAYFLISYIDDENEGIVRKYEKSDIIYGGIETYSIEHGEIKMYKYKIVLKSKEGIDYSINIYCPNNL